MKRALVTGSAGFIGRSLCRHLEERAISVVRFDRAEKMEPNNEADLFADLVSSVDCIFHIAGTLGTTELLYSPFEAISSNVNSTVQILEAVKCHNPTCKIFFPTKPNNWLNVYSITKFAAEQFCEVYRRIFKIDVRSVRWLNVYGPGQKVGPVRKAIPLMICQALENEPITIWGNGNQPVDLIYIEDLIRLTVDFMSLPQDSSPLRVIDTGLSFRMNVNELVGLIIASTGSSSSVVHAPMRLGEYQESPVELLPSPQISDICKDIVATDLIKGMNETVDYYRSMPSSDRCHWISFFSNRGW